MATIKFSLAITDTKLAQLDEVVADLNKTNQGRPITRNWFINKLVDEYINQNMKGDK